MPSNHANLKSGYKGYDVRTRKMRQKDASDARHQIALIILTPTGYSGTKATRVNEKGEKISRQALRDFRKQPIKQKGNNNQPPGTKHDPRVATMGIARTHYENIGLGMKLRCPLVHAFKHRYKGGAWNK